MENSSLICLGLRVDDDQPFKATMVNSSEEDKATLIRVLEARSVTLHDRTWYGHIVKGHPDVSEHRAIVERTVRSPDAIHISRLDANCRLYYGPGPRPTVRMMVVVDVAEGVVKTAHLAKRMPGGKIEWSK